MHTITNISAHTEQQLSSNCRRLLSVRSFCSVYGISRSKFYLLKSEGLAPTTVKIGRRTYIRVDDSEAWLATLGKKGVA